LVTKHRWFRSTRGTNEPSPGCPFLYNRWGQLQSSDHLGSVLLAPLKVRHGRIYSFGPAPPSNPSMSRGTASRGFTISQTPSEHRMIRCSSSTCCGTDG
jgi:hypothetical protein